MTIQEIDKEHQLATQCLDEAGINDAFGHISTLVDEYGRADMNDELVRSSTSNRA